MTRRLLGAALVAALVAAAVVAYDLLGSSPETYTVTADISSAPNLFAGGRVMVRGVEVGDITEVEPRPGGVRLTLEIDRSVKVPAGARLNVIPITVISDRYVQLVPAYSGGPELADGAHISIDRTAVPAELDDVLTQLHDLLTALEPAEGKERGPLAKLLKGLDLALRNRDQELAGTLDTSAAVLENLANSESDITQLIRNLDRLFVALANRSVEIATLNVQLERVFESLRGDQEHLEGTIENLALLAGEAEALISASGDELGESFGRLGDVADDLLAQQKSLLQTVRWTNVIAQALGVTNASGRGLYAYSGKQATPGSPGAEYNYRIDTRDTIACERIDALIESFLDLNPNASIEQLRDTLLSFIPVVYKDDLAYLVDQLIPLCATLPGSSSGALLANSIVEDAAERVGDERFAALIGRWLLGRSPEGPDGSSASARGGSRERSGGAADRRAGKAARKLESRSQTVRDRDPEARL